MRIIFTVGSLSGGGAERVVARLSSEFADMGHEVFVCLIASNKVSYHINKDVQVRYVETKTRVKGLRYIFRSIRYRNIIKEINPDIVISFTAAANIFVLHSLFLSKFKVVISERNNPYLDPSTSVMRCVRDCIYHLANGIVFQTEDAKRYFARSIQNHSAVIINPIDINIPKPYLGSRKKKIVTVGRLEPQKNHKLLIEAFAEVHNEIRDYELLIYGVGSLETSLRTLIDDLNMKEYIHLMGFCDDVLVQIKDSSLFVLSSDYEGISNSLLEAMAMGLPVVSTDHPIGGARLLIEDGKNGLLVNVGDKEALKNAILKVIKNDSLSEIMAKEAIKVRVVTSLRNVASAWIEFIKRVR